MSVTTEKGTTPFAPSFLNIHAKDRSPFCLFCITFFCLDTYNGNVSSLLKERSRMFPMHDVILSFFECGLLVMALYRD